MGPEQQERPASESNQTGRPPTPTHDTGSFLIARVAKIPIRVHFTFLLLLAWVAIVGAGKGAGTVLIVAFVATIFTCVVLHELGHAAMAKRLYGISTREIVLYPIGGVARLERLPEARQELWISLAGPAVNLLIAAGLWVGLIGSGHSALRLDLERLRPYFASDLMWANLLLAVFNLIPAFPMDGGRVLRALLARVADDTTATTIAARVGQGIAVLFGLYAVLAPNFVLLLIAVFVYLGAGQEAVMFQTRALITGHRVREAMMRDFRTLPVGSTLGQASDALLAASQQDFPVVHGGEVVGVLSRSDLLRGLAAEGPDGYVAGAMQRDFSRVSPDESLDDVLTRPPRPGPIMVMDAGRSDGELVGMLTQENLLEFLMLARLQLRGDRSGNHGDALGGRHDAP